MGWTMRVAAMLVVVALAPAKALADPPQRGAGCDPSRPAVAHRAGGVALDPQPPGAPHPCGVHTGYPSGETRIGVTPSGTVIFSPAAVDVAGVNLGIGEPLGPGFIGVAISRNGGLSWTGTRPDGPLGPDWPGHEHADDQLYVDKQTGRVFWTNPGSTDGGTAIIFTDDDGANWHYSVSCCAETENPAIVFGKPVTSTTHGYPTVVYYCGNVGTMTSVQGAICHKSLDGGNTWITAGQGFTWHKWAPSHPECGTSPEEAGYPAAASDGSLYLIVDCDGVTYLARSTDEGATWPIVRKLPFPGRSSDPSGHLNDGTGGTDAGFFPSILRMDARNTMYLFRTQTTDAGDTRLVYSTSSDEGETWSEPVDVLAPGVVDIDKWYVAVGAPGELDVSYLGRGADQSGFDGYITYTRNAASGRPTFWSAMVNAPGTHLTSGPAGVNNDFIGADIGPGGTPWASFFQWCSDSAPAVTVDPSCVSPPSRTTITSEGFAAHLAFPGRAPDRPAGR